MKTKVIVLAGLLLVASASSALAGEKDRKTSTLSELVKKEIAYPDFAREMKITGVVDIYLVNGEEGPELITIGNEPQLHVYVADRISAIENQMVEALEKENTSHYRLTFRYVR
ncbi:MAG: hypothetical protein R6W78_08785 [Bacteroidales bacterium]